MPSSDTRPHSHALRIGRVSEPNRVYVLTAVTYERRPIFVDLWLGRVVVNAFRFQQSAGRAATLAFVVMPDHFHWLVQLSAQATLAAVVQSVKGYSGHLVRHARGSRGGRIWQPGFHDHAVRREEDLEGIARYIVENPLRKGLARTIGEYPLWDAVWGVE